MRPPRPPLSSACKGRIQHHLFAGLSPITIADIENCHEQTVRRYQRLINTFGTHTPERHAKRGPPYKILPAQRESLRVYLAAKPWAYLDEMQLFLFDMWGVLVSTQLISKILKNMKISRKSLRREATERSYECRHGFKLAMSSITHDMIVCLDESGANEHTAYRKRGWAPFGIIPWVKQPLKRSERWSVLPAYCSDGVLACTVYHGGIDGPIFAHLKEQVLPRCSPFPGPRSVLVMDNCSTHLVPGVQELCDKAGVVIRYLPPYSPDFNPIEELFSVAKAWMKRHCEMVHTMSFREFIYAVIAATNKPQTARAHFQHAGYMVGRSNSLVEAGGEDSDSSA